MKELCVMQGVSEAVGIYVSVPFCRAKCTFCNFASDAFAPGRLPAYVEAVCDEMKGVTRRLERVGAVRPRVVDTVYFGGGTPSLMGVEEIRAIFAGLRGEFEVAQNAEITVECAPGQLETECLAEFLRQGVNRFSFGVQSFVDRETKAVGRLHTTADCLDEIARVRAQNVDNVGVDLIAGLPYQTEESWRFSLETAVAAGVTHVSVYLLEVDEESRLGREVLLSGQRYSAGAIPSEEEMARFYEIACEVLGAAGVEQYEISNFARRGYQSRHNLKYWRREAYLGFGLDAHSMCLAEDGATVRFSNTDDLDAYLAGGAKGAFLERVGGPFAMVSRGCDGPLAEVLSAEAVFEETLFLGLRMNAGLRLGELRGRFPEARMRGLEPVLEEAEREGLMRREGDVIALTDRGRLLSNEVFERLLV